VSISRLAARVSAILLLLCVGLLIEANLAYAQNSNANLSGTVTDSSGAMIVDAKLTLTNTASLRRLTSQTTQGDTFFAIWSPAPTAWRLSKRGSRPPCRLALY